ncbi:MAG: ABC transporter permease subunit [Streptosporangiaceae bacterium]|jgi:ABC-type transport system involved in multi-copper enzyme maturation permease subunit
MIAAEWLKFRTVRGWVVAVVIALAAIAFLELVGGPQGSCNVASCTPLLGPGGEPVSDNFYFVGSAVSGNGTITARVSSLTSDISTPKTNAERVSVPWAKAGLILKASLSQGSAYVAIMITGTHGVRMQDDFTGDIAGPSLKAAWLRLVRDGSTVTGYASADGAAWTKVGTITLQGLPRTVHAGMFVTSPQYTRTSLGVMAVDSDLSQSTATFDDVSPSWPAASLTGTGVGEQTSGPAAGPAFGYSTSAGRYTITGTGDIAPSTDGPAGSGVTYSQVLGGTFLALILLVIIGAMFVTAEYRSGLIRVTLAACPKRGRVLAAKAFVTGTVAFAAGLTGAAIALPLGLANVRDHGAYLAPVPLLTEIRLVAGTAAVLALCAVLAVAIGAIVRRGIAAVAAVTVLVILPYVLSASIAVLPLDLADWLMRLTPAAAFAVQQTAIQYPQIDEIYSPDYGYWPLPAWGGFAVLCAWTAAALALAYVMLNRRDA